MSKKIKDLSPEKIEEIAKDILESHFWLPSLETDKSYTRLHDDHDGEEKGKIIVYIDRMGDVRFYTDLTRHELRFRTLGGGGISPRTRNALLLLALAIKMDEEKGSHSM